MEPEIRTGCWPAFVMATVVWAAMIYGTWAAINAIWPDEPIRVVEAQR